MRRLLAVLAVVTQVLASSVPGLAVQPTDNTWVELRTLPEPISEPILALAVDPSGGWVLVGTSAGSVFRSLDGGDSWTRVHQGSAPVVTVAVNPFQPGQVFAGTDGDGVWESDDDGVHWSRQQLPAPAWVRSFGFTRSLILAGTNHGLVIERSGHWISAGLDQLGVTAVATSAINDPAHYLVGADATSGDEAPPLYQADDSSSGPPQWSPVKVTTAATMVNALAAGPLRGGARPVLLGTNSGALLSGDSGSSWKPLNKVPQVDFNQVVFTAQHWDRFYLASDGGGTGGGLWATTDFGDSFRSLKPPMASITALAVTGDETPVLYVAAFRPQDHAVTLWCYRDAGGEPQATGPGAIPLVGGSRPAEALRQAPSSDWRSALLTGPEAPFLALGLAAIGILLLALVSYARRGRA